MHSPAPMPPVTMEQVTRRFADVTAVAHLCMEVEGTILGLIGPSGSGKTTTLRLRTAAYLLPVTNGIRLLQDVILRGVTNSLWQLGVLAAVGLALFVLTALPLRRSMARA